MKPSNLGCRGSAHEAARRLPTVILAGLFIVGLLATPVLAQPNDDSNIRLDAPGFLIKKPKPGPPDVKTPPQAWPRLDRGAVLCRSASDLERLAARRRGEAVQGAVDCQIIRGPTGVTILSHNGPGMTQVSTNDPAAGGTGWTDAWLPDKPPSR